MGLLINGQWHDQWYDTKPLVVNSNAANLPFVIGLHLTEVLVAVVLAALRPRLAAIICMFPSPARGRIVH